MASTFTGPFPKTPKDPKAFAAAEIAKQKTFKRAKSEKDYFKPLTQYTAMEPFKPGKGAK